MFSDCCLQVIWLVQSMIEENLVAGKAPMRHPSLELVAAGGVAVVPVEQSVKCYDAKNPRRVTRELVKYQMATQRHFQDSLRGSALLQQSRVARAGPSYQNSFM